MTPTTTIADLPDDLLAHVLRFATDATRRDGQPTPAVPLSAYRYSTVSTSFRRAFLKNLHSLSLTTPSCGPLSDLDWSPITHCPALRRIHIGPDTPLRDISLTSLFQLLHSKGTVLRQADLTLDRDVTHITAMRIAALFGPSLTHFALRVPQNRRAALRSRTHSHFPNFPQPPINAPPPAHPHPPTNNHLLHVFDPPLPVPAPPAFSLAHLFEATTAPGQALDNNLPPPLPHPPVNPAFEVHLQNAQNHLLAANWLAGAVQDDVLDAGMDPAPIQDAIDIDLEGEEDPDQAPNGMDVVDNALPNIFHALNAVINPDVAPEDAEPVPVAPQGVNQGDAYLLLEAAVPRLSSIMSEPSDDVLSSVLARMPMLREFHLERAPRITMPGIIPLAKCVYLEALVLYQCPFVNNAALKKVLPHLPKLRLLKLSEMSLVGDATISALCTGPTRKSLQCLELNLVSKVTDPAVKQLVNTCEKLVSVRISDCPRITCAAASHLSCSLQLKNIFFKPTLDFPLTNRTIVHFSCAACTLQSLELVGCWKLSLDGIVALGNLPGLRRLHLRGLGHVSQDVMRHLGTFPKLDDLLLDGGMHLTDLGVKVLIAQRGHRFLHLAIIDSTRNLSDEALECVMTWCVSLRRLEIHGQFKSGAIDRLSECMPSTALRVSSDADGCKERAGRGCLWDPEVVEGEEGDRRRWIVS